MSYLSLILFIFHKNSALSCNTLYLSVEKENIEIIRLLLTNDKLDINKINILNIFFPKIQNHIFQLH